MRLARLASEVVQRTKPAPDYRQISKKVICIGRNYNDGKAPPTQPIVFMKPSSSIISNKSSIRVPEGCGKLVHEVELGVVIGKPARFVKREDAYNHVAGYTLALDMTARDILDKLIENGHPWFLAKSFDTGCALHGFIDKSEIPDPHKLELQCSVNGEPRQCERTSEMFFDIPTLIEFTSQFMTLEPGDLILTGTPAGVSACKPGDRIDASISGHLATTFNVIA
ncbi:unnamed protein product [Bursaphelenchus okinawaensis]|uniref:oxaloacetate tautomerase n=1 Tax=Bursaphelenchus okinawaensis TaxID=465554 RepID=A0A811KSS3_9BILA|nr:unnamed protein product [Bursaphelenchus okinawaensis]CAG9110269.1 unnamed protein product [Bursaphelenchus okinawaensis]